MCAFSVCWTVTIARKRVLDKLHCSCTVFRDSALASAFSKRFEQLQLQAGANNLIKLSNSRSDHKQDEEDKSERKYSARSAVSSDEDDETGSDIEDEKTDLKYADEEKDPDQYDFTDSFLVHDDEDVETMEAIRREQQQKRKMQKKLRLKTAEAGTLILLCLDESQFTDSPNVCICYLPADLRPEHRARWMYASMVV